MARVRVVRRAEDLFQVYLEKASGKGKKVRAGKVVAREDLKAETARLMDEEKQSGDPGGPF